MQFFEKHFHFALPELQNERIFYSQLNKCVLGVIKKYFLTSLVAMDTFISFSKKPKTDLVGES